jgi:hypothetical protein
MYLWELPLFFKIQIEQITIIIKLLQMFINNIINNGRRDDYRVCACAFQ